MSDLTKLLDNGWSVLFFRSPLGSYTAVAVDHEFMGQAIDIADDDGHLTDDFTPEKAAKRLCDKLTGLGIYGEQEGDSDGR